MKAKDIMTTALVTGTPDMQIDEIAKLMLKHGISGVPIVDAGGAVVGLVSEGDLMRRVEGAAGHTGSRFVRLLLGEGTSTADFIRLMARRARDIMTRNVVTVTSDTPVGEIARTLDRQSIKRVPVVDGGRIVGLVSRANLLRALASAPVHPMAPDADDDTLRKALLEEIAKVPGILMVHIQVTVQNRKAAVWGLVTSDLQAQAARVAAESVEGLDALDVDLSSAPAWVWGI